MRYLQNLMILIVLLSIANSSSGQDCSILSKANDIVPDGLCAPVSVDWKVTYRGVNNAGTSVQIRFDWDDGSAVEDVNAVEISSAEWQASHSHVYPTDGDQCNYRPNVFLVVDGVVCTSSVQEQVVTVWDVDDQNGGLLYVEPPVFPICFGHDGTAQFWDGSRWNCTPPDENDVPNNRKRWIQWIYGTNNTAGNFIDDAQVDGVVESYPYESSVAVTSEPILAPTMPWNRAEPIYVNDSWNVGDEFEITLNNWNYCNPYDKGFAPVTQTGVVRIVDYPDATITPVGPFCESDGSVLLSPATGGGTFSGPGTSPSGWFTPRNAGPGLHTIHYDITDDSGCSASGTLGILVYARPTANISASDTIYLCPGAILNLNGNPAGGAEPYEHSWTGGTGPLSADDIPNPVFQTLVEGEYELVYRVEDAQTCYSRDTVLVAVSSVEIYLATPNFKLCKGISIQLDPQPQGGSGVFVNHVWTGDRLDLLSGDNIQTPDFSSAENGVFQYNYYVKDSQGCENDLTVDIEVIDQPIASAGDDDTACALSYALAGSASIGDGTWTQISGVGTATFTNDQLDVSTVSVDLYGTYVFQWKEASSWCVDSDRVEIGFYQLPVPTVMPDADTCGMDYRLVANPDVGLGGWQTVSGPGNVSYDDASQVISNISVDQEGTYEFSWREDNGGCIGSDEVKIDFFVVPSAKINPFNNSGCSPIDITFSNASTHADVYLWNFGDGSISDLENPQHKYTTSLNVPQDFELKMIALTSNGCSDTVDFTIKVSPSPVAKFTVETPPGCSPLDVSFDNLSEGASSYKWDFGDGSAISTQQDVSHVYLNETLFMKSLEVELAVSNNYSCRDTARNFVSVYPDNDYDFVLSPAIGCSPLEVAFEADAGAVVYEWDFGDGSVLFGTNEESHVFTNDTSDPLSYTIDLSALSVFGCGGVNQKTITVNPSLSASFNPDVSSGCTPLEVSFTNSSVNGLTYVWDFGDGSPDDSKENVTHIFINDGADVEIYKVKLMVTGVGGCQDSTSVEIEVYPNQPYEILATPLIGCHPLNVSFNSASGANEYNWDFGDGEVLSGISTVSHVFYNETSLPVDYTISLSTSSVYGCGGTTQETITVNPTLSAAFIPDVLSGCTPLEVNFTNTSGNGLMYEWDFGDSSPNDNTKDVTHVFTNDTKELTTYEVKLMVEGIGGCLDSAGIEIQVYPNQPYQIVATPPQGCHPLNVTLNTEIGAVEYYWDYGDGESQAGPNTVVHQYLNKGAGVKSYTVSLSTESSYGCTNQSQLIIAVADTSHAQFLVSKASGCSPLSVDFTNVSAGAVSYEWRFGDGSAIVDSRNSSHQFQNVSDTPQVFEIELVVASVGGCKDSISKEVEVYPRSQFDFVISPPEGCHPLDAFLNADVGALSYQWDFGDGETTVGTYLVKHKFNNTSSDPLIRAVTLTAESIYGCVSTSKRDVLIYPTPIAKMSVDLEPGCSPLSKQFENESVGATEYEWNFNDGSSLEIEEEVDHTFINNGIVLANFNVLLKASNGFTCSDTDEQTIKVYPYAEYNFSVTPESGCHPLEVDLVADLGALTYEWDYGDGVKGSGSNTNRHTYVNETTSPKEFTVTLNAQSVYGCGNVLQKTVVVNPFIQASYELTAAEGCSPLTVTFENTSTKGLSGIWYLDDGEEWPLEGNSTVTYTYENDAFSPLLVSPKLVVDNGLGCKDSASTMIQVFPLVSADVSKGGAGCSPFAQTFVNGSSGASIFKWNFGDGGISNDFTASHVFANNSLENVIYRITMTASSIYGCSDVASTMVEVYPKPSPQFAVSPVSQQMPESTVQLENTTEGLNWTYLWKFGNGDSSPEKNPLSYTYSNSGMYEITLIAEWQSCEDSVKHLIEIIPTLPIVEYGPESEGCSPLEVDFYAHAIDVNSFVWDFGDGNVSSQKDPVHSYFTPGNYTVELTATGPGGTTILNDLVVRVFDKPIANFEIRPAVVDLPASISFISRSKGASEYLWNFGDGNTATIPSVQYEYEELGVYDISLWVANDKGCEDEMIARGAVTAKAAGDISFPNAFTPNPSGSEGGYYVPGARENYVFYPFVQEGIDEYKLQIYSRWGELLFESQDVNIGWDGYFRGKICEQGVYIWKVEAKFSNGKVVTKTGDVTLFR